MKAQGLSKQVISRVISARHGVTLIVTLLITNLLSPLKPLQVEFDKPSCLLLAQHQPGDELEEHQPGIVGHPLHAVPDELW